ncbi:hypothetical protein C2845_PM13G21650 [Panicum miliaceum]|uniref:Uncharacterized protein n=1 Tax=Panicum miliaceum TaxID=4540 RepID=A0A3L6RIP9_PANMI|nr:hypothetical protein C2845_PM13G21650 [Panicum miliaceum]
MAVTASGGLRRRPVVADSRGFGLQRLVEQLCSVSYLSVSVCSIKKKVDRQEFCAEMREVMLAVANGLGFLPVQMVVEEGSFLKIAVDRELGQLAKAA